MYFAIVNPATFNGKEDVNGRMPVMLNPVFGLVPYRRIINGTIAHNSGLEVGKTYLVQIEMVDNTNPATGLITKQPQVTRLGDGAITALELATNRTKFLNEMGAGKVEAVTAETNEAKPEVVAETEAVTADDSKPF
jgi:hypothetical protein